MSKATAAKLAVLVFLAFIICLPEFFPSDTDPVLQILFYCLPFDPCDPVSGHHPEDVQICQEYRNTSRTAPLCENVTSRDEAVRDWFVCETQADLRSLHDNASLSEMNVEVVLTFQTTKQTLQNVTMDSLFNQSGLHIETRLNFTLFGCCSQPSRDCAYPHKVKPSPRGPPNPTSHHPDTPAGLSTGETDSNLICQSNGSQCLFLYVGNDVLQTQTKEARWWGFSAAVWIVLVLIVVIVVLLSVCVQVYTSRNRSHTLGDLPDVSVSVWSMKDEELFLEKTSMDYSREKLYLSYQEVFTRGLSPIHEVSMTDVSLDEDNEGKMFDCTVTEGSEGSLNFPQAPAHTQSLPCLHHRSHPSLHDEEESP